MQNSREFTRNAFARQNMGMEQILFCLDKKKVLEMALVPKAPTVTRMLVSRVQPSVETAILSSLSTVILTTSDTLFL